MSVVSATYSYLRQIVLARSTYSFLRLLILAPLALLFLALLMYWAFTQDLPTSISGTYGTTVRDVFVGCLFVIGGLFIVYTGHPALEDFSLNMAGYFAIFVALVPNSLGSVTTGSILEGVTISLIAALLIVATFSAIDFKEVQRPRWSDLIPSRGSVDTKTRLRMGGTVVVLLLCFCALTGVLIYRIVEYFMTYRCDADTCEAGAYGWVHNIAAISLFICQAAAISTRVFPEPPAPPTYPVPDDPPPNTNRRPYIVLLAAMFATGGVWVFGEVINWRHKLLVAEVLGILIFAIYWVIETRRERETGPPDDGPGAT